MAHLTSFNIVQFDILSLAVCTFERVEEFKYLGTTLTKKNSIPEEIESKLR